MKKTSTTAPRVSVLMGVYNCANTLEPAIKSILEQSFDDFELIACDDGSSDESLSILKKMAKADSRLRILENDVNCGLAPTLNRCAAVARGSYLARMDGDDESLPTRFAEEVAFLDTHPDIALVGSAIEFFDDNGCWGRLEHPGSPTVRDFLLRSPFAHPTIMLRASVLEALGGYSVEKRTGRSEDYELFMRLYAAGYRGANLQTVQLRYREERASFTKRKFRWALVEAGVRVRGYKKLGLLPGGLIWALKPVLVALVPARIWRALRRRRFK